MSHNSLRSAATSLWPLDEVSGTRADSAGSIDLTDVNTVTSTTGLYGTNAAFFTAANNESLTASDNDLLSVADDPFTISVWVKLTSKTSLRGIVCKGDISHHEYLLLYDNVSDRFQFRTWESLTFKTPVTAQADNLGSPSTDTWYLVHAWHDPTTNQVGIAVNNGTANTAARAAGMANTSNGFTVGNSPFSAKFDGAIEGLALHKGYLFTSGDRAEDYAGPEPTYTSGASLAANGAYNIGTWDAQNNGTSTYEWVVVEADGTVVDQGTGATGTADFGATTGLLTLLVRASNDGGYDVGDFATRTSGYGSSGDGYYEVATTTAVSADGLYSSVYPSLAGSVY